VPTSPQKPAVYLLDSMAFIFRAYHAMQRQRPMSTRSGVPTAATYVFVNMIHKLRRDFSPQFLAAVYDLSGPVFRDAQAATLKTIRRFNIKTQQFDEVDYAGYKANRPAMPDDLAQQLPYIRRALESLRIPILSYEGFEADDVIGTLAKKASDAGHPVFVVSSDKDMMQLVTPTVRILNPAKDNLILDPDGVRSVLGVAPAQVIDVMALRGDAVDNVPGAPGIGEKGSVELIQQFGSVESALDHADEVKGKRQRESLQNNREAILLSKELVTIHTAVPVDFDLDAMRTQPPDSDACRALYTELEFTTLLKELGASAPAPAAAFNLILEPSAQDVATFLAAAKKNGLSLAIAAEEAVEPEDDDDAAEEIPSKKSKSGGAKPAQQNMGLFDAPAPAAAALRIGLSADGNTALLLDLASPLAAPVLAALADESLPKSLHDLKSVLRSLAPAGIELRGVRDDLMLYSYLVNPTHSSHRIADVAARTGSPLNATGDDLAPTAAAIIHRLAPTLRADVEKSGCARVYAELDLPLPPVLLRMEQAGVRIDPEVLRSMSTRLAAEINTLTTRIFELAGDSFNLNSPRQLSDVLFNQMKIAPPPRAAGKGKTISTAQSVLDLLADEHEIVRLVLEYRQLAKLKSTYLDQLPAQADADGRIHTTLHQAATATGRLSSTGPNLQNIPVRTPLGQEIRAAFIPAPGNLLLSADYSQIELRLLAHFSQDPLLLKAYREGIDIHTLTASEVFGVPLGAMDKETRNRAKAVNFGIVYGISAFGLANQLGIPQREAADYIEKYFQRYAGVKRFIDATIDQVRKEQLVRTLFGRVRPIPDIAAGNQNLRGFAERTAINTPLQGTAADMMRLAMIRLDKALTERKLQTRMTLQVHDELLFDAPAAEVEEVRTLVRQEMENVVKLSVPIVAEVASGPNWRDAK
jgi:DNA polymerase-1